jgi:hypothetical protein
MDSLSVFVGQTEALRRDLRREKSWLEGSATEAGAYVSFAAKVLNDTHKLIDELDRLAAQPTANGLLQQQSLLEKQTRAANLFGEILTLRTIEAVRSSGGPLCLWADQLLRQLANSTMPIPLLTTVADSEFFGVASRIIRMRYPATSIWDLCILGHEFGHAFGPLWYVSGGLDDYPHRTFIKNRELGLGPPRVMDEYFCDLLAVFLLGPAYVYTCILTRFNPERTGDGETHPPDVRRAWWILRGLELLGGMAEAGIRARYQAIADGLRIFWTEYCERSQPASLGDETKLELAVQSLFLKMSLNLPSAAYVDLGKARGLQADFEEDKRLESRGLQIRDLLNAAWLERAEKPAELEAINIWAMQGGSF